MERSSSSPHAHFFASLKRLEKRLKLEDNPSSPTAAPPPPSPPGNEKSTEEIDSLGTPIYLNCNHSIDTGANASNLQESIVPLEFLTGSPDFPATHQNSPHKNQTEGPKIADGAESFDLSNIELLMQFLCLSDSQEHQVNNTNMGFDDAFYGKIVGMKGPKSVKEAARLEGWIKYFMDGEKKEPYTLALLLLGKSALVNSENTSDGFKSMMFPSSVDEFLQTDPPID